MWRFLKKLEIELHMDNSVFESVLMRWIKLEPIIQSEVSQKEKHQYSILTHIYMAFRKMVTITCETAKERQMHRTVQKTVLWETVGEGEGGMI